MWCLYKKRPKRFKKTTMNEKFTSKEIEAYIDGQLTGHQKAEMETWLAQNPALEKKVREDMAIGDVLDNAFAQILNEPVPDHLLDVFAQQEKPKTNVLTQLFALRPGVPQAGAFAAVAIVFFALGGGFWQNGFWHNGLQQDINQGQQQVMLMGDARNTTSPRAPVASRGQGGATVAPVAGIVDGDMPQATTAEPLNWLTQKVALETKAPDLSAQGFGLVDRKLVTYQGQKSVQLLYQNAQGKELSLYMKARWQPQPPVFKFQNSGKTGSVVWEDGPLLYALSSPVLDKNQGMYLAQAVREAMAGTNPAPQIGDLGDELGGGNQVTQTVIVHPQDLTSGMRPYTPAQAGGGEPEVLDVQPLGGEEQF